ncbi:MAG: hypothetical protein J0L61_13540, partial [Planctomycetes bacterium]|nr:hypothetical protein [Planctomycetota bacterium]
DPAPEAPARFEALLTESERLFGSVWAARAEMAADSRARMLQSIARNTARIASAAAIGDAANAERWKAAESRWNQRADSVPKELGAETPGAAP